MFRILLVALISCLALPASAETVLKIATLSPDGSAWMQQMRSGADAIDKRTQGRVKFKFYPGGVMGDDAAVLRKIRIGQLHGGAVTGGAIENIYPDSQIYNLPLAFKSFDEVDHVRKHLDKTLREGLEQKGFVSFGFAEGGLAYPMTKGKPIEKPEDLKEHKVWAPPDDEMSEHAFEAFGITPIPLGLGDVLSGLQTNLVDTIASPPVPAIVMQWHTQVKTVTTVPLSYIYALMVIDQKMFNKITAADQAIVREEMGKAFDAIDKLNRKDNINAFDALAKQGITVIKPSAEYLKAWYDMAEKTQKYIVNNGDISSSLYERMEKLLHEFRQAQGKK